MPIVSNLPVKTTYTEATHDKSGLMSSTDKEAFDSLNTGAVRHDTEQVLTDKQKTQAKENLGVKEMSVVIKTWTLADLEV